MSDELDVKDELEPVTPDDETEDRSDPDDIGGDEGDKGPVPYDRFKEVNDLNREFKRLGYTPTEIAERMAELGVLKQLMTQAEEEPVRKPQTEEEKAEAYQKEQAKKLILELFPQLAKEKSDDEGWSEAFRQANAAEAWYTTVEVMEDAGMEVDDPKKVRAVSGICKEIIEGDPKLLSKFMTGKADFAVKAAFKELRRQLGVKADAEGDPRPAKIRDKKKLSKLTRVPKGGGVPERKAVDDQGPANLDASDESVKKKLEALGF